MEIAFQVDDTHVTKKFSSMLKGFKSFRRPFRAAGDELLRLYGTDVFDTNGKAIGDNWRALSPSTLMARTQRTGYYRRQPIRMDKALIWTGNLKEGFRQEPEDRSLRIYNGVPYFKYHQRRGGRPPQRKMLAITSRVIVIAMKHITEYTSEVVNERV